ncbi:MAG: endonuclease/exonuclease/phosphatase family protein [Planctomycetota bacterium]
MRIRVLSWNIHKGIGGVDRRYRPERTLRVISHYRPDLVLLQEVDEGVRRSSFHRQVDLLGDALGLRHRSYGPNVRVRGGRYGNATLSHWPLTQVTNIDLTLRPKKRRGALYTRCRVRPGPRSRTLVVLNLHLGLAGFERFVQLKRLLGSASVSRLHRRTPVVLAGDFNDLTGSLGPRLLRPAGFERAGRRRPTYPAFWPLRPLDGVFVRGDVVARRSLTSRMALAREASDHLPIVADLDLSPTNHR